MKKMLIAFLATGCLLAIYLTIRAGSTAWGLGINLPTPTEAAGIYTFTAGPIPDNGTYGYSYFWFFDDGSYDITTGPTLNHKFQEFNNSGNNNGRLVHVEVTRLYKKDDKPIAVPINPTLTINTANEIPEPKTALSPLSIEPNRWPVPGDSITYIVTYGKLCDGSPTPPASIMITYDDARLVYKGSKSFHDESFSSTQGQVDITLQAAAFALNNDEARRVFLTFEVKPDVKEDDPVGISGNIFLAGENSCSLEPLSSMAPARLSHDPNYIVADQESLCAPVAMNQMVTYTIHFQNIGDAPAEGVEVRTYLPLFFSLSSVFTKHPNVKPLAVHNREIIWKLTKPDLKGGKLRGMGEPGYGIDFLEEDTKDRIEFQVYLNSDSLAASYFDPCQAIVNQAEITFDCNPSIRTNFYTTDIVCLQPDSTTRCACNGSMDTIIVQPAVTYYSGNPETLDVSSYGNEVIWYPRVSISDPFSVNPTVTPSRSTDYVAVVKGPPNSCTRSIIHFPVKVDCQLSIAAKVKLHNCKGAVAGDIKASAQTSGNPADLVWNWECNKTFTNSKKGKRFCMYNLPPDVYHLTVKDTKTGCWAETTVIVPAECPKSPFPWKKGLIGALVLVGILVLYGILKKKKP